MRPLIFELDGQRADLPADYSRLLTFANGTAALADLDVRRGEYAFPFTLPDTRANGRIFGPRLHPQTQGKFSRTWDCRVQCDGEEWRGTFRLTSLKNGYTGTLTLPGFAWADALKGRTLRDLTTAELPAINYNGTQLETILAKDRSETDVQFPLVLFGNCFAPPITETDGDGNTIEKPRPAGARIDYPLSVDDYLPSVYYLNVLHAIFKQAGYSLVGEPLTHDEAQDWCVTAAGADPDALWPWGALLPSTAARTPSDGSLFLFSYFAQPEPYGYSNNCCAFDEERGVGFWPLYCTQVDGGTRALNGQRTEYLAPRNGVYSFAADFTVEGGTQTRPSGYVGGLTAAQNVAVALVVFRNGQTYANADAGLAYGTLDPDQTRLLDYVLINDGWPTIPAGTYSLSADDVYLEAGETVQLLLFCARADDGVTSGGVPTTIVWRATFTVNMSAVSFACTAYDGPLLLEPAKCLPPLAQVDFVKDFLLRTNSLLTTDTVRRVVALRYREAHTLAQGPAVDLTEQVAAGGVEFLPPVGGASALVFQPADPGDDSLAPADTVRYALSGSAAEKVVAGQFAAVGRREMVLPNQNTAFIPTVASVDRLAQPLSESSPADCQGATPRVVRYRGTGAPHIDFQRRSVAYGLAEYTGTLAWAGSGGAVATWYGRVVRQAQYGHAGRVELPLSPARYRLLTPGRRVLIAGAEYSVETLSGFCPADDDATATLDLISRF